MTRLTTTPLFLLASILTLLLATACSDSSQSGGSASGTVVLRIAIESEGQPLTYDEMLYHNAALNLYSVTKFNFLMTQIDLSGSGGTVALSEALLGQFPDPGDESHTFENVPVGDFDTLRFEWGVADGQNEDGALGQAYDAMHWPPTLGGGYHAMQLEGDWDDGSQDGKGYAMHAGHLRRCAIEGVNYADCDEADRINQTGMASVAVSGFDLSLAAGESWTLDLVIDVNGWMADPLYDLSAPWTDQSICPMTPMVCTLGSPTMSGPEPQQMMQENAGNVFSVGSVFEN